jgi:DNA-binding transcriptional MerR regulator
MEDDYPFTVGQVAKMIKKCIATVRNRTQLLSSPPVRRGVLGIRFYSAAQVEELRAMKLANPNQGKK